jgi:hypothetical protein
LSVAIMIAVIVLLVLAALIAIGWYSLDADMGPAVKWHKYERAAGDHYVFDLRPPVETRDEDWPAGVDAGEQADEAVPRRAQRR